MQGSGSPCRHLLQQLTGRWISITIEVNFSSICPLPAALDIYSLRSRLLQSACQGQSWTKFATTGAGTLAYWAAGIPSSAARLCDRLPEVLELQPDCPHPRRYVACLLLFPPIRPDSAQCTQQLELLGTLMLRAIDLEQPASDLEKQISQLSGELFKDVLE